MNQDKKLLRTWLKSKRLAMDRAAIEVQSKAINQRLIELLNFGSFKRVHCYRAIASLNEVDTERFINFIKQNHPDTSLDIQEQSATPAAADKLYDVVIVPVLGFDRKMNRLGWGGGWYDQLLATQPKALKIGLCPQSGLVAKGLPAEPHDVPLDMVITEEAIIKRSW